MLEAFHISKSGKGLGGQLEEKEEELMWQSLEKTAFIEAT